MTAEWLTERLGGAWRGTFGSAPCPAHEDRRPSLSIRDGDEAPLLKCHAGCRSSAVVDALRRRGLWPIPDKVLRKREPSRTAENGIWAVRIWREALPIAGTIGELYLRTRGIADDLPPTLRYARNLKHRPTGLFFPAMIAAVQSPARTITGIQRTFLKLDGSGKATVSEAKLSLGAMGHGAVRLAAAGEVLGIAEGVETSLSVTALFGLPCWASLGAERLGRIGLPAEVRRVVICGDIGSEAAAYRARDMYMRQGREAEVRFPAVDKDFNDVLMKRRAP